MLTYLKKNLVDLIQQKQPTNIAKHLSDSDLAIIQERSQQLLHNTFVFDKPWDMERCLTPYTLEEGFDFNTTCNNDEEWCYMLNRMDYLNYLILQSYVEDTDSYMLKCKDFIFSFIKQHPTYKKEESTRTLDTGIRMMNIFEALPFLYERNLLNDDELCIIQDSLLKQAAYLKQEYLNKYTTSNWGVIQTCSIIAILPYIMEDFESNEIYQWAYKEACIQFEIQVNEDGIHWEYSPMYQVEVLNYGLKAFVYQNVLLHRELPFKDTLINMVKGLMFVSMPNSMLETWGDSDRISIKDITTCTAAIFKNTAFKYNGLPQFDYETLYFLGCKEANAYKELPSSPLSTTKLDSRITNLNVLRSNWEEDSDYLLFLNTGLGSGHGHCDNLHVSLCLNGQPILVDSGRYTYREDHPLRMELKGTYAHNCITIDGNTCCIPSSSWSNDDFGLPLSNYAYHKDNMHYYEGAFLNHNPNSLVRRKIVVVDHLFTLFMDEGYQDGTHTLTSTYHFDPSIQDLSTLHMYCNEPFTVETKQMSLSYNNLVDHKVLTIANSFENHGNNLLCFLSKNLTMQKTELLQDGTNSVTDDVASAYKLTINDNEAYYIALFHEEIFKGKKLFTLNNMPFHAQAVLVHEVNGYSTLTVLKG